MSKGVRTPSTCFHISGSFSKSPNVAKLSSHTLIVNSNIRLITGATYAVSTKPVA